MCHHRSTSKAIVTDEGWPEISTLVSRLSPADPTPREVNVSTSLSAQDLKSLKKSDPFLYYSIPGVLDAAVRTELVDMHQIAQNGLKEHCQSCPASIQTTSEPVAKVKRCTRMSFECHIDLLFDELSNGLDDMVIASEDLLPDEPFDDIVISTLGKFMNARG